LIGRANKSAEKTSNRKLSSKSRRNRKKV